MRIGYFDCFSGASGDMILAALVAAGLGPDRLRAELSGLKLDDEFELRVEPIRKQGFAATQVVVRPLAQPGHRHLHHITEIIDRADLSEQVKASAKRIFTRLAEAEAKVHGTSIERVHFHEVGATDAIVDIVGAVIGIHALGLERVICSPIPTGSGTVVCDHGTMPVPAPATAELLVGVPLAACDETGELITPTGAAILTTLAHHYGPLPAMTVERYGWGAGRREGRTRANLLRLFVGEASSSDDLRDEVVVLEANLDDATGEQIGHAFNALFAAGALDVYTTPITMKKNRPGVLLAAIVPFECVEACEDVLFDETTTFGVRHAVWARRKLERRSERVPTAYGPIRMKVGERDGRVVIAAPEYADCAAAAAQHGVALRVVMAAAQAAWDQHVAESQIR